MEKGYERLSMNKLRKEICREKGEYDEQLVNLEIMAEYKVKGRKNGGRGGEPKNGIYS